VSERPSAPFRELAWLGGALLLYVAAPILVERTGPAWGMTILPGLALLAAMLVLLRRCPPQIIRLRGTGRVGGPVVALLGTALVAYLAYTRPDLPAYTRTGDPVAAFALILLVPWAEELFFRGFLLDHLARNLGRAAALLATTLLFAGLHAPQGTLLPMLVLGFAAGLAALLTRSAGWAIAVHLVWNACAVGTGNPTFLWQTVAAAAAGLVALWAWGRAAMGRSRGRSATDAVSPPAGLP